MRNKSIAFYERSPFHGVGYSVSYHTPTYLIPSSVNGVGPQMQMRTLDLSKLAFKKSERRAGEMCPCLPLQSEVGAERTNSTSNLGKRNKFKKCVILNILPCFKFSKTFLSPIKRVI